MATPETPVPESHTWLCDELRRVHRRALHRWAHRPQVTGVTMGRKIRQGRHLDDLAIRVHVREKITARLLGKAELLPKEIDGVPVDVVQRTYRVQSLSLEEILLRKREVLDPIQPGIGVGLAHPGASAGTFGLLVFDRRDGRPALLSAAHVLAAGARPGSEVLQPAPDNNGRAGQHTIATLAGSLLGPEGDAAFARLNGMRRVNPLPLGLKRPVTRARGPEEGEVLVKSGCRTGVTRARVESVGTIFVHYEHLGREIAMQGFELRTVEEGNPANEEISRGGDSGSVWLDEESGEGVGLHVAGETHSAPEAEHALACHLPVVLDELGLSLTPTERTVDFPLTEEPASPRPGV